MNRYINVIVFALFSLLCSVVCKNDTKIPLRISFLSSVSLLEAKLFAGAFFVAVDAINGNASILTDYKLEYLFHDTKEQTLESVRAMTSHYAKGTIGFIGPDVSCACESTNAAAWNLPMIVYKCHDSALGKNDKESVTRRTFARTQPSTAKVSKSILSILEYYKWNRLTLVVGSLAIWNETAESLKDLCKLSNIYVNNIVYFKEPYAFNENIIEIVETTYSKTRIYVFLGDYHGLIDFVRLLKVILKDKTSDYVVIAMDERLFTEDPTTYFVKTPFESHEDLHDDNLKAFEPVMLLVPRPPLNKQWEPFLDDVRKRNEEPPINGLSQSMHGKENVKFYKINVPIYAAYLYDAVTVYARTLDAVLKDGGSANNGTAIIEKIRNTTFTSVLGYEVYIDGYGDAEGNYTLLRLEQDGEEGQLNMKPVGNFRMTQSGVGIPELNLYHEINWPNGAPPVDEPPCGFEGEKCVNEFDWKIVTVCIIVATVVLIASGFVMRHYLYEQKLARLLWKVDYKDIVHVDSVDEIIPPTRRKRRSRTHPLKYLLSYENESERTTLLSENKHERSSSSEIGKKISIGSYKGTIVAVKHVIKKNVEIDRNLKKALQVRKELNHDNITRFIGACVETPHVYILTNYCARGSLQDILKNEDITLDNMFISSLVSDLIKGMIFIHDSEIGTHGNLKSSNCVIDSRWVLMVTDFGLHQLVNERSGSGSDKNKYYEHLVWKAPELLRNINRSIQGSQKADVYSFALILYEMYGRKGPFGECQCDNAEIVENVRVSNSVKPFRPDVAVLTCETYIKECMDECWNEDPDQRPDFKFIRYRLKSMLQGLKSSIIDNMLHMMEKYAHNLEDLVNERTELLAEEKKMTENLLLRMLPRFVADQLKRGDPVIPENYDCVSIYFSDIVGFTALSAESTPLQVVCMLNDLYTCFDAIVENYDVYKIETIGDAYLVVSGLPVRNDDLHAGEIASMSLHLLEQIKSFKIRHRPNDTLKLRIGLHSGPCVAGVVGLKMPRYTLFGDTVNTASRMESTGVPLKIHCSSTITALLTKLGGYQLTERGYINAKGKGEMLTFFLEGEDVSQRKRRISHSKLHRTNSHSPEYDPSQPIFGKSTIHPKYWPNGNVINEVPNAEEMMQNCDIQIYESPKHSPINCDITIDKNRTCPSTENMGMSLPTPPACVASPVSFTNSHPWSTSATPVSSENPNSSFLQKSQSDNFMQRNHSEIIGLSSPPTSNNNNHFNGPSNTSNANTLKISKPERLPLLNETNL